MARVKKNKKASAGGSNYDFVKVRVRLRTSLPPSSSSSPALTSFAGVQAERSVVAGSDEDNYDDDDDDDQDASVVKYVLSRYLISRTLVTAMVSQRDAVQIALQLKKTLVDLGAVDVDQSDLERYLFEVMNVFGYGDAYVRRFRVSHGGEERAAVERPSSRERQLTARDQLACSP